jgi:hypothetical protein
MPTPRELFWSRPSFVFIGNNAQHPFPHLSFGALKRQGRKVFAVDPELDEIEGSPVFRKLSALPEPVEAAVLELPLEDVDERVEEVLAAGIRAIWFHQGTHTSEAVEKAREAGAEVWTGGCAAMYTVPEPSFHMIHKWFVKLGGRY